MNEGTLITILLAFLSGGGVGVAVIGLFKDRFDFKRKRKAAIEDREYNKIIEQQQLILDQQKLQGEELKAQGEGVRFLLYDKIKYLGQEYVKKNEVSFEDRKNLHKAHNVYHNGLHGNGDLDGIMKNVDDLPLKVK